MNFVSLSKDIEAQCYMIKWELGRRTNRRYWNYLRFSEKAFQTLRRCPAANAGYQLFRQQALAEAITQNSSYSTVISCVAYDERNEAVKKLVKQVIEVCNKKKKYIGICGQAPSDYQEFAEFVVECGIQTMSLNPDTVIKTTLAIAELEKKLGI